MVWRVAGPASIVIDISFTAIAIAETPSPRWLGQAVVGAGGEAMHKYVLLLQIELNVSIVRRSCRRR
jgi:hypothetical protein